MEINNRYNRQELIEGWDQSKLESTRVAVFGSGNLANYSLAALSALGVGNIEIYDSSKLDSAKEFLFFEAGKGESKAKALENILRKINPSSRIKGIETIIPEYLLSIVGTPDFIIETTNSPESKKGILNYAQLRNINVISASADEDKAEMYIVNPGQEYNEALFEKYSNESQGVIPSGIIGGILTEELRKSVMPLGSERIINYLRYSLLDDIRFSSGGEKLIRKGLDDKKILVVGAGALGNFATLGAALEDVKKIDIMDFDRVDATNLNRQILFYDSVGKEKATALAEKIKQIVPSAEVRGLVEKLTPDSKYFEENKPDLILDCVDGFPARAIINYFAVKHGIPLVSGGTDPKSGQVVVYEPGKSACLDCKFDVEKALAEQRKSSSCRDAPDPSVIMTNQIVGNMMVGEAIKVLEEDYGEPVKKILKYDSTAPRRGGLVGSNESCDCTKPDVKEWLEEVDRKIK